MYLAGPPACGLQRRLWWTLGASAFGMVALVISDSTTLHDHFGIGHRTRFSANAVSDRIYIAPTAGTDSYKPLAINRLQRFSAQTIENKGSAKSIFGANQGYHRSKVRVSCALFLRGHIPLLVMHVQRRGGRHQHYLHLAPLAIVRDIARPVSQYILVAQFAAYQRGDLGNLLAVVGCD